MDNLLFAMWSSANAPRVSRLSRVLRYDFGLSRFGRNQCPACLGISVQVPSESLSSLGRNSQVDRCSEFCRKTVLPLLQRDDCTLPLADLRDRLRVWLEESGESSVLICDSPRDIVQLQRLFPGGLPPNCSMRRLGFWENLKRRILNVGRRVHRKHALRVHHALDDAMVNMIILTGESRTAMEAITRNAIAELDAGKGKRFASVDELMSDLHAVD